ncbi:Intersectin-1 [Fasciola gigantica]|uniref:Intersectin-1 n=1 Tax=Fasciola gigantica TaxID=46835 RepID=A0A504YCF9_FASGI|nr:Intersectin-1 [Fasciola gigantica]
MRELETQREVRRRQAVEARAKAWRAAEAQRQLEAEKQRVDALKREKSQTQTALEQAIAHRASLLESANAQEQRRRELDARLMVAQNEVDAHKSAINEMRQKRDAYQRDIRELTEQVEAAKAELTRWQREHEQLSLRVSTGVDTNPTAEQCKTLQANRELRRSVVGRLKAQLQELDSGMTQKGQELASRRNRVEECEQRSSRLVTELMDLHRLLEKKMHEYKRTKDPSSERGGNSPTLIMSRPFFHNPLNMASLSSVISSTTDRTTSESDKEQYEVMFDFTARHPDELTLTTGMIFNVYLNPPVTVSPGWLYGECNGIRGMFPESYVRKKITGKIDPFDPFGVHKARVNATPPVQPDRFVPDGNSKTVENRSGSSKPLFACLALYPYESTVTGDLNLAVNDVIQVHTIRDDWYEGFNERSKLSGMFPANYTRKLTAEETALLRKETKPSSPAVEVAWPTPVPPETTAAAKVTNGSSVSVAPSAAASIGLSSQADPFSPSALPPLTVAPSFTGTTTATTTTTTSAAAAASTTVSSSSSPSSSPNTVVVSTKPEFARVIAPYTATAAGQLSLQPGQVVQLRKRSPKGWWEGELQVSLSYDCTVTCIRRHRLISNLGLTGLRSTWVHE